MPKDFTEKGQVCNRAAENHCQGRVFVKMIPFRKKIYATDEKEGAWLGVGASPSRTGRCVAPPGAPTKLSSAFGGLQALHQCEELTTWANELLRRKGYRLITDLRKGLADGLTLVNLIEVLSNDKITGIHTNPAAPGQKSDNLRQCVSYLESKGVDTQSLNPQELADGNLKSTLMFMNSVRKRYEPQFGMREMADGASQPAQTSSRPNSAHARYTPEWEDIPPPIPPGPKPFRPLSGLMGARRHMSNGSMDILPGSLGRAEEETRPPAAPPAIISTTELDSNSAYQRGGEERRTYIPAVVRAGPPPPRPRSAKPMVYSETPPPPPHQAGQAWTSSVSTPKLHPKQASGQEVRETVSLTVEERLKSLLSSPNQPDQPEHHLGPIHHGQVNGAFHYEEGELILPPPRKPPDHGQRGGVENTAVEGSTSPGHFRQGSLGNGSDIQTSYVPSQPSERMPGVSRGQAILNARPQYPVDASPPVGDGRGAPALPPKLPLNGPPPRYQPPPQYSPYLRRSADGPPPNGPPKGHSGQPQGRPGGNSSDLRNACNKLYVRDSHASHSGSPQPNPPSQYSSQQWQKYGMAPTAGQHPRTSPMGQSSSGTPSQTSGQASTSSHSPSSPIPRRPGGPLEYRGGPSGGGQEGLGPNERRHSGQQDRVGGMEQRPPSGPPYPGSSHAQGTRHPQPQDNQHSGPSTNTEPKMPYDRLAGSLPASSIQKQGMDHRTTNVPGVQLEHGGSKGLSQGGGLRDNSAATRLGQGHKQYGQSTSVQDLAQGGRHDHSNPYMRDISGTRPPLHPQHHARESIELQTLSGAKGAGGGPESASAMAHHASQMALKVNKKWRDSLATDDGNYSPSISSSRSVTPPLPPLSPDNTPPQTPPDSPSALRHGHHRSVTAPGYLARTPDVVTSTAKQPSSASTGKKKQGRRSSGGHLAVRTWEGKSKKTLTNKNGKKTNPAKPPRPHSAAANGASGDDSIDQDTNESFTEADYATVNGTGTGSMDAHEARIIRQQLEGLETMYHEILKLLGLDREYIPGSRRSISSTSSISRSGKPRMKRSHSAHHRSRDIKQVNKRFARLESHVVTLARSVAHLSSEMRTHNALYTDIEEIKRELVRMKELSQNRAAPQVFLNEWERFRGWVPSLTNPKRVNKLTKFFGQEPPLLHIFLKKLGYEKYVTNFEQEKIGMIELPYMNEDRLQRIGIPMGPRLRILQEAQLCFRQENFDIYIV